jgi:hypothetical protein
LEAIATAIDGVVVVAFGRSNDSSIHMTVCGTSVCD